MDFEDTEEDTDERETRRSRGRVETPERPPNVRHDVLDGQEVVYMEITGQGCAGAEVILDADDYAFVAFTASLKRGLWWRGHMPRPETGKIYVHISVGDLDVKTGQSANSEPNMPLSRYLTGAMGPNEVVRFINGNTLDHRRSNLRVIKKREHVEDLSERGIIA